MSDLRHPSEIETKGQPRTRVRVGLWGGRLLIGTSLLGLVLLVWGLGTLSSVGDDFDRTIGVIGLTVLAILLIAPLLAGIAAARGHASGEIVGLIACLPLALIAWSNLTNAADSGLAQVVLAVITAGFSGAAVLLAIAVGRRIRAGVR